MQNSSISIGKKLLRLVLALIVSILLQQILVQERLKSQVSNLMMPLFPGEFVMDSHSEPYSMILMAHLQVKDPIHLQHPSANIMTNQSVSIKRKCSMA
jgi:hypothetical protein